MRFLVFADLMRRDLEAIIGAPAPAVFRAVHPVPLAIGTFAAIIERHPDVDEVALGRFLKLWTLRGTYLANLARGGPSFDLDGLEHGIVTQREQEYAAASYKRAITPKPKAAGSNGRPIIHLKPVEQRAA